MFTKRKKYLLVLFVSIGLISCASILTNPNSQPTKMYVSQINKTLIDYYPDEIWEKSLLDAYAVNNGIIVYIKEVIASKNPTKYENIIEEINALVLETINKNCKSVDKIDFFFILHDKYSFSYYKSKNDLKKYCENNKISVTKIKKLSKKEENAAYAVRNAVQYKLNFGADRGVNVILEP